MRRFYLQLYFGIVAIVLTITVVAAVVWDRLPIEDAEERFGLETLEGLAVVLAPPPGSDSASYEAALGAIIERVRIDLSIYRADGTLEMQFGERVAMPSDTETDSHFVSPLDLRRAFAVRHDDGRWFVGRTLDPFPEVDLAVALLAIVLFGVSIGAWPFARRLTRRLERLRDEVESLGAGDLSARVQVEGRDSIADLARSFNRTADTIEQLVDSQRGALAAASHELRSPLARLRVAIELLEASPRPELLAGALDDVRELEGLIDEILLASRLERSRWKERFESTDLLGLVAEEAARTGAEVEGEPTTLRVEPTLVRRLVRNLLENAARHGKGRAVEVAVAPSPGGEGATIAVADRGPGVPEADRERIFEPFFRSAGWAEGQGGGVGLGLALVRQIAERHGGQACCEARPGGGSRFVVSLQGR